MWPVAASLSHIVATTQPTGKDSAQLLKRCCKALTHILAPLSIQALVLRALQTCSAHQADLRLVGTILADVPHISSAVSRALRSSARTGRRPILLQDLAAQHASLHDSAPDVDASSDGGSDLLGALVGDLGHSDATEAVDKLGQAKLQAIKEGQAFAAGGPCACLLALVAREQPTDVRLAAVQALRALGQGTCADHQGPAQAILAAGAVEEDARKGRLLAVLDEAVGSKPGAAGGPSMQQQQRADLATLPVAAEALQLLQVLTDSCSVGVRSVVSTLGQHSALELCVTLIQSCIKRKEGARGAMNKGLAEVQARPSFRLATLTSTQMP